MESEKEREVTIVDVKEFITHTLSNQMNISSYQTRIKHVVNLVVTKRCIGRIMQVIAFDAHVVG